MWTGTWLLWQKGQGSRCRNPPGSPAHTCVRGSGEKNWNVHTRFIQSPGTKEFIWSGSCGMGIRLGHQLQSRNTIFFGLRERQPRFCSDVFSHTSCWQSQAAMKIISQRHFWGQGIFITYICMSQTFRQIQTTQKLTKQDVVK